MAAYRMRSVFIAALLAGLLVACAPVRVRTHAVSPEALAAQDGREKALAPRTRWTLQARIGISGENGGSGDLTWRQDGSAYTFSVRAVTGKTLRLSGDQGRAVLEGVDPQPDTDSDPERLLRERLGADVPFVALRSWVLGLRAPGGPAQMQFNDQNLPALLEQDGWKVEYLDWFIDRTPALPKKVFATRGKAHVKIAIQSWAFD
jgi:outer membrane lipoprotein LolB